jgi:tRNA(fMet)-specific endonuclease VapC
MTGSYLLDTNIVIALFAQDANVRQRLSQVGEVFVPSIVLGELYYGARKSGRVAANVQRVDELAVNSAVAVCDAETAQRYGVIKNDLRAKGKPLPENDIWIAALAIQHGLTLVSRDAHFNEVAHLAVEAW